MSFDDDNRDAPFVRPAATIRISGPDGELTTIECEEFTIDPALLPLDYSAKLEAARQIAFFETAQAEQIAARLESTDAVLSAAIRRELARRETRPQQRDPR